MTRVLVACAIALSIVLTGCGSELRTGASSDPATIAPRGTLAFASFEIAPDGREKASFDAAFGKLLGDAPEAKLGAAFTRAAQTSGKLDYLTDVRPWLGKTLSLAVTRAAPDGCDFALLAASTDDDAARAAIDKDLAGTSAVSRSYRDVSYKLLGDGTANGVVSHFLVAGTEAAFKAVVDASKDGQSLSDTEQWKAAVGDRGKGKVGLAYLDAKGLLQSFASGLPGAQRVAVPLLLGLVDLHPFVATLEARPDALVVDVSSPGTKPDPDGPAAASSPLIETFPADAWLAAAAPKVGETLTKALAALKANPLIAAQYGALADSFRARTGLDIDKDLLTLGDAGLFARGTTPSSAGGTLVAHAKSATLQRLRALLASRTKGRLGVRAAVRPAARLGAAPLFEKATAAVGGRPTVFVDFARALELARASAHDRSRGHLQQALPRLRHIEFIAAGARRAAGLDVVRGVVGLR
ncbi:MAG TPA: DUF3352 domain-containing protein [Thermoleophilaceae bacterium]|nr:DUF3352 domain-containing protein [Thermoleophilaceae bacterium]